MANLNPLKIGFVQAVVLLSYVSLVAFVMWQAQKWFGPETGIEGTILFLTLFVTSALISATITLGYPVYIVLKHQATKEAIQIVVYTIMWLAVIVLSLGSIIALR